MESVANNEIDDHNVGELLFLMNQMPFLPSEVWFDVFDFLTLVQLGTRASLACRRFNALARACIEHPKRARVLQPLLVYGSRTLENHYDPHDYDNYLLIPIAQVAPPKNILGFKKITIHVFKERVVNFLRAIKPLLWTRLELNIMHGVHSNLPVLDMLMPMLRDCPAPNISLSLAYRPYDSPPAGLAEMFNRFPEVLERKVYLLAHMFPGVWVFSKPKQRREWHADIGILLRWLFGAPLEDGKPRLLAISYVETWARDMLIQRIVKAFVNAEQPANFLVRFWEIDIGLPFIVPFGKPVKYNAFSLKNERTGENLVLRSEVLVHSGQRNWFLRRGPMNTTNADQEALFERELIDCLKYYSPNKTQQITVCMQGKKPAGQSVTATRSDQLRSKRYNFAVALLIGVACAITFFACITFLFPGTAEDCDSSTHVPEASCYLI